jgi:hypothetical protein
MGRLFEFGCEQCGYQAEVSGGEDAGWLILTQTMTCLDCKRVVDVVAGNRTPVPSAAILTSWAAAPAAGAAG